VLPTSACCGFLSHGLYPRLGQKTAVGKLHVRGPQPHSRVRVVETDGERWVASQDVDVVRWTNGRPVASGMALSLTRNLVSVAQNLAARGKGHKHIGGRGLTAERPRLRGPLLQRRRGRNQPSAGGGVRMRPAALSLLGQSLALATPVPFI